MTQRWTVSNIATAVEAASPGYGFALLPEELIRGDLASGDAEGAARAGGSERYAEMYLVFADRERAGPGTLRLAEIVREEVSRDCRERGDAGL